MQDSKEISAQLLFSELDESIAIAEQYGWVSEEKANEYIGGLLVNDEA
jgi:hypothetical protein